MNFWQSKYNPQITLSQRELLEISQKINRSFPSVADSAFPELVLLPVDPYHLYAYWSLGENSIKSGLNDANHQLTLRVYWWFNENTGFYRTKQWFDIKVNGNQRQQKIQGPKDEAFYSAVIGKYYPDDGFAAYAYSNSIQLPRSKIAPIMSEENERSKSIDEPSLLEEGGQYQQTEWAGGVNNPVSNAYIMKDNLYVESTKASMNLEHKLAVTSHFEIINNDSGLGIEH
jgi:hypothetical protein